MTITKELFEKAKEVTVIESILKDGVYNCKSKGSKNEWQVSQSKESGYYCNCPAFSKSKNSCKHVVAVMLYCKKEVEVEKKSNNEESNIKGEIKFNFDRYEVISAFHKSMRKGDVLQSWYWLQIMIDSGNTFGVYYINNYILGIIAEELCICDIDVVAGLKSYLNPMAKKIDDYMLYAAVDIFCSLPKFWECERCWERKVNHAKNISNIREGKKSLYDIPYYAFDRHTLKGSKLPENKIDWRYSGTWIGMLWRRKCVEQGKDINTTAWNEVVLDKEEFDFYKKMGEK